MYVQLIKDVALLVALTSLHTLLARVRGKGKVWPQLLSGVLFGGVAVVGMAVPFQYQPGIFYDGRSIVLALSGLFGGWIATGVSVAAAGVFRALRGGAGVWAGLSSIVGPALLGLALRRMAKGRVEKLTFLHLYGLGIAAHLVMLASQLLLMPWPRGIGVIRIIWLPILLIYPAGTALIGYLLRTAESRVRAEDDLREREARYRTLFDESPVAIWEEDFSAVKARLLQLRGAGAVDLRAHLEAHPEEVVHLADLVRIVEVNAHSVRLFGADSPAQLVRGLARFLPNEAIPPFREELLALAAGQRSFRGEFPNVRLTGEKLLLQVTLTVPPEHADDLASVLVSFVDITEQRRTEEQLRQAQKMETVGRLAGGVAHDFNNMLQVILSYVDLSLAQLEPTGQVAQNLREVRRAAGRSADLTGQLLAFARRQTMSPRVMDLNEVLPVTRTMIQRLIGEDIELAWLPGGGLWRVKIDPIQLDQVLANLAVNARDAIGGVGRLILATANAVLDEAFCQGHPGCLPGEYVLLSVSDTGKGMDRETLSHLFEPFFTTKEMGKGTGLGLATIYGIVKQNRGFITVESEPGRGSTFRVYLPRVEEPAEAEPARQDMATAGGTETVLVVEDEAAVLRLVREGLGRMGYTVLTAASPEEAERTCREHVGPIHLLITDVVMPQMNGRELAERLSVGRPGLKCLFMSGYTANVVAHRGVLDEGVSFVAKPFTINALAAKVRKALDG